MELFGIWLAALLTLCIFSFLYDDNPFYKFAEHLFVGVSAGYGVALQYHSVILPNMMNPLITDPLHNFKLFSPLFLSILLFTRFFKKISWLSRWSIALMVGSYSGLAITGFGQGDLMVQLQDAIRPLWTGNLFTSFNNTLATFAVIATLIYFFFSKEHKGVIGITARIGILFLMISFGASFGYTVMARVSLLIGRMQFLLGDWLHLI